MSYSIASLMYLFALVAASLAAFGVWGLLLAGAVVIYWLVQYDASVRRFRRAHGCLLSIVLLAVLFGGLLYFAVTEAIPAARRSMDMLNMKQIELALLNYEAANKHFPPVVVRDAQGNPLYSWRVELLPYLEQQAVYDQMHLDEPWDSPHNRPLLDEVDVYVFHSHLNSNRSVSPTDTDYVAVVGEETLWPETGTVTFRDVRDGTSNTLNVIEARGLGIHWAEPRDVTLEQAIDLMTGQAANVVEYECIEQGYFVSYQAMLPDRIVGYLDGHVEMQRPLANRGDARALFTRAGREKRTDDPPTLDSQGNTHRVAAIFHWDHIMGLALLIVIVLLPAVPAVRRRVLPTFAGPAADEALPAEGGTTIHDE